MSNISVANGWKHTLAEAIAEAATLPSEWLFEIVKAEKVDGALKLSATYNSFDVPLDDHLPADHKLPHPWRALQRIGEAARAKSLVTCECCGLRGKLIGSGDEARVRCAAHVDVVDAVAWSGSASTEVMFESTEEAMAHFLADFGDGRDMMQQAQREGVFDKIDDDKEDDNEDKGKRH